VGAICQQQTFVVPEQDNWRDHVWVLRDVVLDASGIKMCIRVGPHLGEQFIDRNLGHRPILNASSSQGKPRILDSEQLASPTTPKHSRVATRAGSRGGLRRSRWVVLATCGVLVSLWGGRR
jgi:hypothetical protein